MSARFTNRLTRKVISTRVARPGLGTSASLPNCPATQPQLHDAVRCPLLGFGYRKGLHAKAVPGLFESVGFPAGSE
jgi:hypothetical protein